MKHILRIRNSGRLGKMPKFNGSNQVQQLGLKLSISLYHPQDSIFTYFQKVPNRSRNLEKKV